MGGYKTTRITEEVIRYGKGSDSEDHDKDSSKKRNNQNIHRNQ